MCKVVDSALLHAPGNGGGRRVDFALAASCVRTAARRRAGCMERTALAGCKLLQRGEYRHRHRSSALKRRFPAVMKEALKTTAGGDVLLPAARLCAMGLLAQAEPQAVLA